jgi:autotransporter translocation and assembly factor TamB
LTLDGLLVDVREGVWFATKDARARLGGELTVYKDPVGIRVFGTLEGDQGTFTMRVGPLVRRFQIEQAKVRFFGTTDPNPSIDAVAKRVVLTPEGQRLEVLVTVSGTLTSPTLALSTPEGAVIPESELLSVLVFGQPNAGLTGAGIPGQALAEDILFSGIADYAGMELEEALLGEVGVPIDYFLIRTAPGPSGLFQPTVVLGKQLTNDIFLTVESGVATLFNASLEWQVDRQWTVELNAQPLNRARYFRGVPVSPYVEKEGQWQIGLDARRRWTY